MFEGLTLDQQRQIEIARGWKGTYSALTYCTAEAVVFSKERIGSPFLDSRILVAERIAGVPDCLGKTQGKWGTYVKPTDKNAKQAIKRCLTELFGWHINKGDFVFKGIIGPELYKSTIKVDHGNICLQVTETQAEDTPFEAKIFAVDASGYEIRADTNCHKSTKNVRWVPLRELINDFGQNSEFLYWTMVAIALGESLAPEIIACIDPGTYKVARI